MRRFAFLLVLIFVATGLSCAKQETAEPAAKDSAAVPAAKAKAKTKGGGSKPADKMPLEVARLDDQAAPSVPPKLLPREQYEAGWISLFDGRSLFGWKHNGKAQWTVTDGAIVSDGSAPGFLMTTFQLADYELQCEFQLAANGNSGLFLRTPFEPKDPKTDCYELNLCDAHPDFPTGSIVGRKGPAATAKAEGDWKKLEVTVVGEKISAKLDGQPITDFSDTGKDRLKSGHIGLQNNGGRVAFREIRLRPLGTTPLFDGENLNGWKEVPGSKSKFAVADKGIHIAGGPGFIESEKTLQDFVLQLDFRTNGDQLNSGFFFRAQPGTAVAPSNGYEFQIHSGYKDGDRAQPVDSGSGAIFRRAAARWVVSDDRKWSTGTLIANGPHFSTWIDGYQVVDWTDTRKPHENPRQGKQLEAGHISLQGHDETTDVDFRQIRYAEIPD